MAADGDATLRVRVVYLPPGESWEREVLLPAGATVADAVHASEVLQAHPELAQRPLDTGVFGHLRALDTRLHDGDRVELYRGLTVDPKEARRIRAEVRRRRSGA